MAENLGKLVLRLSLGGLLLFHGINKLLNGLEPIKSALTAHNIPAAMAYGVYLGELVAPVLIIVGLFSRVGGAFVVVNMIVALTLMHLGQLAAVNPIGGGYALELQIFYLASGLAVALIGAGRFSVGSSRWN
ncbi:MAG: DoxX family protein [Rhizomicrobium sp.]